MERGGCLCGAVRYELSAPARSVTHCHCGMCRKQHGAAFATYAMVARGALSIHERDGALGSYRSTPKVTRAFCRVCGSSLFWSHDDTAEWIGVAVGSIDGEPARAPDAHIHVADKAAWVRICDELPQYAQSIPPRDAKAGD